MNLQKFAAESKSEVYKSTITNENSVKARLKLTFLLIEWMKRLEIFFTYQLVLYKNLSADIWCLGRVFALGEDERPFS